MFLFLLLLHSARCRGQSAVVGRSSRRSQAVSTSRGGHSKVSEVGVSLWGTTMWIRLHILEVTLMVGLECMVEPMQSVVVSAPEAAVVGETD